MRTKKRTAAAALTACLIVTSGCGSNASERAAEIARQESIMAASGVGGETSDEGIRAIGGQESGEFVELEDGLSYTAFLGDDGVEEFLSGGGAGSDADLAEYLNRNILAEYGSVQVETAGAGSALAAADKNGTEYFGRNYDGSSCDALILRDKPENGYSSISTVNLNLLSSVSGTLPDQAKAAAAVYLPADGVNIKGLAAAVILTEDADAKSQDTDLPDLTPTTAIRLLLNRAADVDEALELLEDYDMHFSSGTAPRFVLMDAEGRSAAAEYGKDGMSVTDGSVFTDEGEAVDTGGLGGTAQTLSRYATLSGIRSSSPQMSEEDVMSALERVDSQNYPETGSTEWSVIYNLTDRKAVYYHRQDYDRGWRVYLKEQKDVEEED